MPDTLGRQLRDLRISVTDRCNMRCTYCMPRAIFDKDYEFLPRDDLLSFEEISRLTRLFVAAGVVKIRLTGGEPLLRRDVTDLVGKLRGVAPDADIAMTTNGVLLPRHVAALAATGLDRVSVSLDALDDGLFRKMTDSGFGVDEVLAGIEAAGKAGLGPIKANAVIVRSVNDGEVEKLAEQFRGTGVIVRFIEYMDVGTTNGWRLEQVVPAAEIIGRINDRWPIEAVDPGYLGEVAGRYRYTDGGGEIGVISSVTNPFCGDCSRARLSADGKLFTCLFATSGTDLRAPLRSGATDEELATLIKETWDRRDDRYSELRSKATAEVARVEMSYIGG
ncbi:MAG: GTP 3',8-cyclase MoaA [Acidimicrobiia bacterium]|nr:GTP 3',8-cyclase MoaA [Acidimicrobiia bacterium]